VDAVDRALELWSVPARWRSAVIRGMREDHGWAVPAAEYAGLYERAIYERAMVLSGGDPAAAGPHTSTHG
jgi:glycogen synthase